MIQLKPTNLYAVIVPERSDFFSIDRKGQLSCDPDYNTLEGGWHLFEGNFSNFRILGTVTKDGITFDFEPYLFSDKAEGMFYKYGNGSYDLKDRREAFYHLLKENGLHFVNPVPHPSDVHHLDNEAWNMNAANWIKADESLVKKVLILKPL